MITLKEMILSSPGAIRTFIQKIRFTPDSIDFQSNIANEPRQFFNVAEGQALDSCINTVRYHYHQFLAIWNVQDATFIKDAGDRSHFFSLLRDVQCAYYCFVNNIPTYLNVHGLRPQSDDHLAAVKPLRYSPYLELKNKIAGWAIARGLDQTNVSLYLAPLLLKLNAMEQELDDDQLNGSSHYQFVPMIKAADDFFKQAEWFSAFHDTLEVPLYAYALSKYPDQYSQLVLPILNPKSTLLAPANFTPHCEEGYFAYSVKGGDKPEIVYYSFCSERLMKLFSLSEVMNLTEKRTRFTPPIYNMLEAKINDIEARLLLPEWAESINDTFTCEQIVNAMIQLILKNKINLLGALFATKLHPEFNWDILWLALRMALEVKPQRISEPTIQCLAKYAGYEPPKHKRLVEFAQTPGSRFLIDSFLAYGATLGKNKNLFSGNQSEFNEKYLTTEFIKTNNFCICLDTVLEFGLTNELRAAFRLAFAPYKVEHLDSDSNRSGQLVADGCKVLKKVMANESSDKFQAILRHLNEEIRALGLKVPDIYLNPVSSNAACSSTEPSSKKIHSDLVSLFNLRRQLNEHFWNLQKVIRTGIDAKQLGLSEQRFGEIQALPLMTNLIYLDGLNDLRLSYPNMTEASQCAVKESLNSIRMLIESINLYVDPLSSDIAKLISSTKGPMLDPLQKVADGLVLARTVIQTMTKRIDDQVKPEGNHVGLFSQSIQQVGSVQPPPLRR